MNPDSLHQTLLKLKCPIHLVQGHLDSEIKKRSMDYIIIMIKSEKKRKIWLKNSSHSIVKNQDHQRIFPDLITFVNEICNWKIILS